MTWRGQRNTTLNGWQQQARARRVIARDHGICHLCGHPGADQADHVVNLSAGGVDNETNMKAVHRWPCHSKKSNDESRAGRPTQRRPAGPHPGIRRA